ncbi:hypothetical protein KY362_03250 [Candidatus Woesearchaeota archaeon]|nr:hypothetical protein [Candidatus Woesearchaeota archaeon]
MWKVAPLKSSFMLAGMLGFLITVIYGVYGRISPDWAFALGFVFVLIIVASIISMTYAPVEVQVKMAPDLFKQPPVTKPVKKARNTAARKAKPKKKPVKRKSPKKKAAKKKSPAKKAAKKKVAKKAGKQKKKAAKKKKRK